MPEETNSELTKGLEQLKKEDATEYYMVYLVDQGADHEDGIGLFADKKMAECFAEAVENLNLPPGRKTRVATVDVWHVKNHLILFNIYANL